MKKFVVITEVMGKQQTRLVPAKDEATARRNCSTDKSKVISCVPYTGQRIRVSDQGEAAKEERLYKGCLAANRRRKGGYTIWQQ